MAKIAHVNYVFLQAVTPSADVRGFPEEIFDRASLPRSSKIHEASVFLTSVFRAGCTGQPTGSKEAEGPAQSLGIFGGAGVWAGLKLCILILLRSGFDTASCCKMPF